MQLHDLVELRLIDALPRPLYLFRLVTIHRHAFGPSGAPPGSPPAGEMMELEG
jgi:hypothetical protein